MKTVSDSMQLEVNVSGGCTKQDLGLAFKFQDKTVLTKIKNKRLTKNFRRRFSQSLFLKNAFKTQKEY